MKHEWPKNWPTFVSDIIGASKANETICENNMKILRLLRCIIISYHDYYVFLVNIAVALSCVLKSFSLFYNSEEVFDFSSGQLTQQKAKHLKDSMCSEFSQIFTLCQFVMVGHNANQKLHCKSCPSLSTHFYIFLGKFSKCASGGSYFADSAKISKLDSTWLHL